MSPSGSVAITTPAAVWFSSAVSAVVSSSGVGMAVLLNQHFLTDNPLCLVKTPSAAEIEAFRATAGYPPARDHRAQPFSCDWGRSLPDLRSLNQTQFYGPWRGACRHGRYALCHRQGLSNRLVGGPVGRGALTPWPTTYDALNRFRRGCLETLPRNVVPPVR